MVKLTGDPILIVSLVICLLIARSKVVSCVSPELLSPEPLLLPVLLDHVLFPPVPPGGFTSGSIAPHVPTTFALQVNPAFILHTTL